MKRITIAIIAMLPCFATAQSNWEKPAKQQEEEKPKVKECPSCGFTTEDLDILNLDVTYHYESEGKKDKVQSHQSSPLDFTNTSSGLQSLIPLFVHLNYLYTTQYQVEKDKKIKGDWENDELLENLYQDLFVKTERTKPVIEKLDLGDGNFFPLQKYVKRNLGNHVLKFTSKQDADDCESIYERYLMTDHCEVFLEEPENNLFPPTQDSLVKWLLDKTLDELIKVHFIRLTAKMMLAELLQTNPAIDKEVASAIVITFKMKDVEGLS